MHQWCPAQQTFVRPHRVPSAIIRRKLSELPKNKTYYLHYVVQQNQTNFGKSSARADVVQGRNRWLTVTHMAFYSRSVHDIGHSPKSGWQSICCPISRHDKYTFSVMKHIMVIVFPTDKHYFMLGNTNYEGFTFCVHILKHIYSTRRFWDHNFFFSL